MCRPAGVVAGPVRSPDADSGMIPLPTPDATLMAGLDDKTPIPTAITLHRKSKLLEIAFDDESRFSLPFEYLRVYSPSAEVRGHGAGQEVLQLGKRDVDILELEPVGNYAVKPVFSDGHDSGLYSWDYLYLLGRQHEALWAQYLQRLEEAGGSRDPADNPPPAPQGGGCGHKH
jgi:DUF971 family protein